MLLDLELRLFIAIDLPQIIKQGLLQVEKDISPYNWPAKWVKPDNQHLTIKFLGNTPQEKIETIKKNIKDISSGFNPFELVVKSIGVYPSHRNPRILWAGISENQGFLTKLNNMIEDGMEPLGFIREKRDFSPHLTLARLSGFCPNAEKVLRKNSELIFGKFNVSDIVLYQSTLTPKGAIYKVLCRENFIGNRT